jgi:proline dehydrogenase
MPNRLILELAESPRIRRFIETNPMTRALVDRFVAGETVKEGVDAAERMNRSGFKILLGYLGEHVNDEREADNAAITYLDTLDEISRRTPGTNITVKLTQLGLDLSIEGCVERMEKICAKAAEVGTTVAIDMESHEYTDRTIEIYKALRSSHSSLVLCLQAYLRRTEADLESLLPLNPAIRLCKGAYNEPSEFALDRRRATDAYLRLLEQLLPATEYTAIATHDDEVIRKALRLSRELGVPPHRYEFQMLYGIRRDLQKVLAVTGIGVRVFVGFGESWYPYLMRRLAERPANLRLFLEALVRG